MTLINHHPSRIRLRDGSFSKEMRSKREWEMALEGHVESAHAGKESKDCAGCRELRKKINRVGGGE
jgi:hypothetical protein